MNSRFPRVLGFLLTALPVYAQASSDYDSDALSGWPLEEVVIGWTAPTENEDGSPITDLAGFNVYLRLDGYFVVGQDIITTLVENVEATPLSGTPYSTALMIPEIGCWMRVTALDQSGNESDFSAPLWVAGSREGIDADADGLPDTWEIHHLGDLQTSGAGFWEDADADGLSDYHEFVAGSDPADASSRPRIHIEKVGVAVGVSFYAPAADGPGYKGLQRNLTLERAESGRLDTWGAVAGMTSIPASGQDLVYGSAEESGRGHGYRVVYELTPDE